MQIVENWAYLIGVILGVLPSPERAGVYEVHVRLEAVEKVAAFPMLVQAGPGEEIVVLVRTEQLPVPEAAKDKPFAARVRAAGPQPLTYFVAPEWTLQQ